MIKISHESPLVLLEESRNYNDYDYALVHLFEEVDEYYSFFEESVKRGREVVLDNSIFELGRSFDSDNFAKWILKLNPTAYIVPDVLEDVQGTLSKLREWIDKYSEIPGLKIGVVQGRTYQEIVECYTEIDKTCDRIAISFDYSLYEDLVKNSNKLCNWMMGRQRLIETLLKDGVINRSKHHHLLGCSLPQEFKYYRNSRFDFIKSIDTSNPVVHGIKDVKYRDFGLESKESVKLVDLIHSQLNDNQLDCIYYNIRKFKKLING